MIRKGELASDRTKALTLVTALVLAPSPKHTLYLTLHFTTYSIYYNIDSVIYDILFMCGMFIISRSIFIYTTLDICLCQ
jgi:hypothetical protein